MRMPSVMGNSQFDRVPTVQRERSQFDRSHGFKTTFDAGWLVPVMVDEVLPGDTINMRMNGFARLATPLKPLMDNLYLDSFFFFVPYRLLWDNFERMMGAQDTPGASIDYLVPQVEAHDVLPESLSDYFGLPMYGVGSPIAPVNALPYRAHNLIWNEWFRDQNLQPKLTVPMGDGPDTIATYTMLRRGKRPDYFSTALPWTQKGAPVRIPMANVSGSANFGNIVSDGIAPTFRNSTGTVTGKNLGAAASASTSAAQLQPGPGGGGNWTAGQAALWDTPHLILNSTEMGTVNQLRQAFAVQRLFEAEGRGGTRYTEWTRAIFGVLSPDARLQRPEYLGGGSSPVVISPIAQTSAAAAQPSPQGNLAGVGTVSWQGHGFAKSFTEHGVLIAYVNVRADLNYQKNLGRQWFRRTKLDFAMPQTAHLGEQAVLNKEIFWSGNPAVDDAAFGYQERFAEYRFKHSLITGKFRSQATGTIDIWHLAQNFTSLPVLGPTFIQDDPPIDRVIAVPAESHFLLDAYFQATWARCLPTFGVPGLVDHF